MGKIFDSIVLLMVKWWSNGGQMVVKWWSNGGQMVSYIEDGTHYSHPSIQKFLDPLS
jgi:hypothetical protein